MDGDSGEPLCTAPGADKRLLCQRRRDGRRRWKKDASVYIRKARQMRGSRRRIVKISARAGRSLERDIRRIRSVSLVGRRAGHRNNKEHILAAATVEMRTTEWWFAHFGLPPSLRLLPTLPRFQVPASFPANQQKKSQSSHTNTKEAFQGSPLFPCRATGRFGAWVVVRKDGVR